MDFRIADTFTDSIAKLADVKQKSVQTANSRHLLSFGWHITFQLDGILGYTWSHD